MTAKTYQTRNWKALEVSIESYSFLRHNHERVLENETCAVDSPMAADRERVGLPCFYYDLEQMEAGLDKIYGIAGTVQLGYGSIIGVFDGVVEQAEKGALVMLTHKYNDDMTKFTVLVEQL